MSARYPPALALALLLLLVVVVVLLLMACGEEAPGDCPLQEKTLSDPHRPAYHVSPPSGWMNDPCGLVYHGGQWHLFYQYNPTIAVWGSIHWGHAVSKDLVTWTDLGPALEPDPKLGMVFTGSVVVDSANSSGLCQGKECLVAVFTHAMGKDGKEKQSIAHSDDGGRTFTLFGGNPVIINPGEKDFRDPRVFWHRGSRRWVMVLAAGDRAPVYTSTDLKSWKKVSTFGPVAGLPKGAVWECPELLVLMAEGKEQWVLKIDLNLGIGKAGSHARYFVGDFDGTRFTVAGKAEGARVDWGEDFYAAQAFTGAPGGRTVWIGWMGSWQYGLQTPSAGWRGVMSLPRELSLVQEGGATALRQTPAAELTGLRGGCPPLVHLSGVDIGRPGGAEERDLLAGAGGSLEIVGRLEISGTAEAGFCLLADGKAIETVVGYDVAKGELFLDRRMSGQTDFQAGFPARHAAPLALPGGSLELRIFIDRSTVEVFAGDGRVVISDTVFPGGARGLSMYSRGGPLKVEELKVYRLGSVKD